MIRPLTAHAQIRGDGELCHGRSAGIHWGQSVTETSVTRSRSSNRVQSQFLVNLISPALGWSWLSLGSESISCALDCPVANEMKKTSRSTWSMQQVSAWNGQLARSGKRPAHRLCYRESHLSAARLSCQTRRQVAAEDGLVARSTHFTCILTAQDLAARTNRTEKGSVLDIDT